MSASLDRSPDRQKHALVLCKLLSTAYRKIKRRSNRDETLRPPRNPLRSVINASFRTLISGKKFRSASKLRESAISYPNNTSACCSGHRHQQDEIKDFLAQLPRLWQQGEIDQHIRDSQPNHWRTRKDPFEKLKSCPGYRMRQQPRNNQRLQIQHPGFLMVSSGPCNQGLARVMAQLLITAWTTVQLKSLR